MRMRADVEPLGMPGRQRSALSLGAPYATAAVLALLVGTIFVLALGGNVVVAFGAVLKASIGSWSGVAQTLNKFCPLLLGSLSVAFGMRGGHINIGVDGQMYAGAIVATGMALALQSSGLSWPLLVPIVMLAGVLGGGLWGLIPGVLRVRYGASEIFVTVMLNFIAISLVDYLANGPWNDPLAGEAITLPIPTAAQLPALMPQAGAHTGVFIALAAAAGLHVLMSKTILGYEIRAVGDNPTACRFAGININRITLIIMPVCGALAGLAGAIEVSGLHQSLMLGLVGTDGPTYGVMAILIAVMGRNRPLGVTLATVIFAVLLVGSDSLQRSINLPASAVFVFQAIMVLTIIGVEARRQS